MEGSAGSAERGGHRLGVANVPLDDLEASLGAVIGEVRQPASRQVVEDDNLGAAVGEQAVYEVTADESGPAEHDDFLGRLLHAPSIAESRRGRVSAGLRTG
jgi:hypothetical protein